MSNRGGSLVGFLLVLLLACVVSFFVALFFGLTFGSVGVAVATDEHLELVGPYVCPEGSTFKYQEVRYSWHEPGESTLLASCIDANGQETTGQQFKALGLVWALYGLVCFAPLLLLCIIFSGVLVRLFNKLVGKKIAPPSVIQ